MCYADKLIVIPEHATIALPICRLAGEVLSIGRRVTQKGVLFIAFVMIVARRPPIKTTRVNMQYPSGYIFMKHPVVLKQTFDHFPYWWNPGLCLMHRSKVYCEF